MLLDSSFGVYLGAGAAVLYAGGGQGMVVVLGVEGIVTARSMEL